MINLYSEEKRMEQEERERRRIANQAWMHSKKKHNRHLKSTFKALFDLSRLKNFTFKKHSRKIFDS
ncbi:hypothetical protein [Lederbergia citri]|uniref:Uncharacterized protein n=1 Tax=Lederbergia citri TaxID=2833580 RepID=A0A942TH26_9BACI|nr:hypothetical protein [Lederbergia citri]MBS4196012.1 hypothetical protein [Lederbergia citri]